MLRNSIPIVGWMLFWDLPVAEYKNDVFPTLTSPIRMALNKKTLTFIFFLQHSIQIYIEKLLANWIQYSIVIIYLLYTLKYSILFIHEFILRERTKSPQISHLYPTEIGLKEVKKASIVLETNKRITDKRVPEKIWRF